MAFEGVESLMLRGSPLGIIVIHKNHKKLSAVTKQMKTRCLHILHVKLSP